MFTGIRFLTFSLYLVVINHRARTRAEFGIGSLFVAVDAIHERLHANTEPSGYV